MRLDWREQGQDNSAVQFRQNHVPMFRFAMNRVILIMLMATSAFAGLRPPIATCATMCNRRGSDTCCGCCDQKRDSQASCCAKASTARACRCSVDDERPTVPRERRNSDGREECRFAETASVVVSVSDDSLRTRSSVDASLLLSLPSPCGQAVLCRWLT